MSRVVPSLVDCPEVLRVATPAATVWRRAAWHSWGLDWPADARLHRAALARMLARAERIALVAEPVTESQVHPPVRGLRAARPLAAELTGLPAELADLVDAAGSLPSSVGAVWWRSVVEPAVRRALHALLEADEPTRDEIVATAAAALHAMPALVREAAPAASRAAYGLVEAREVARLLELVRAHHWGVSAHVPQMRPPEDEPHDAPDGEAPWAADAAGPRRAEPRLRSRVEDVRWEGGQLYVEGYAYVPYVSLDRPDTDRLTMALVRNADGRRVEVRVERTLRPDVAADGREPLHRYDWAGFRVAIDPQLLRDGAGWTYGSWRLEAVARGATDDVPVTALVAATAAGRARRPPRRAVDDVVLVPTTDRGLFAVEVDTVPAVVESASLREGELRLAVCLRRPAARGEAQLEVVRPSGRLATSVLVRWKGLRRKHFGVSIPLPQLLSAVQEAPLAPTTWQLRVRLPGATKSTALRLRQDVAALQLSEDPLVRLTGSPAGRAVLTIGPSTPVVEHSQWDGDRLVLSGSWPVSFDGQVALLSRDTSHEHVLEVEHDAGRFRVTLTPGAVRTLAGELPLPQGRWAFAVREQAAPERRLRCAESLSTSLPMRSQVRAKRFALSEDSGGLELLVSPTLSDDERGVANRHRLRTVDYPNFIRAGLRDEVLFESYGNHAYGDNARAILEELQRRGLGLRCRWVVVDGQTSLPDGIDAVERHSREHHEALARARYLVVPNYRPLGPWYETPADQVVLQTWHGAPYKRIALDNPRGEAFAAPSYAERLRRESARWNWLISPNPVATPLFRQAFGYDGPVLESGYPRTDVFFAADREDRAARVRERLGLPAGKRVVLYAPTMRDDHNYGRNRFRLDLRLDLETAREALGSDHVLLLRRHLKVVDPVPVDGEFSRDVSLWPDVNELLLVTDVLVTDYSSLLFDFACTGRPMVFFTYDLADYRDRLRGLYLDPAVLPGPQVATSEEVVTAIRESAARHDRAQPAYDAFVKQFCPWDDGRAAARVVDAVFT